MQDYEWEVATADSDAPRATASPCESYERESAHRVLKGLGHDKTAQGSSGCRSPKTVAGDWHICKPTSTTSSGGRRKQKNKYEDAIHSETPSFCFLFMHRIVKNLLFQR